MEAWESLQQPGPRLRLTPIPKSHYRMQTACTSMHLVEAPPASVLRVPIARVHSLVLRTVHYNRVFVLSVVQVAHCQHRLSVVRRMR